MRSQQPFRYQLMNHRASNDLESREDWDNFITQGIQELFVREPAARNLEVGTPEYEKLLDEYLIFQAETLGPRITLSCFVQWQLHNWEFDPDGPEKLRRLGEAWAHFAPRPPGTGPDWYAVRKATIEELGLLVTHLADFAKTEVKRVPPKEFADRAAAYLDTYKPPHLFNNCDNLLDYLKSGADGQLELLNDTSRRVSPNQFYDAWWAKRWQHDPTDAPNSSKVIPIR